MSLETGTYLADLVATNPPGNDPASTADDHLRLIKAVLRNSFPGFTGGVIVAGTTAGSANTYTLTPTTALTSYTAGLAVLVEINVANTGASTLNISGLGAVAMQTVAGAALSSGDLTTGNYVLMVYDTTTPSFQLVSLTKNYVDQLAFGTVLPAQSLGFLISTGTVASFSTSFTGFAANEVKGADIASASTINLTTATGNLVHITGTTTITAITIPSGSQRTLVFDGILTLTHNATTLILPSSANITTAAGDVCVVRGDGSGNARVVSYQKANGQPLLSSVVLLSTTVAANTATTCDIETTFNSTYDSYMLKAYGVTVASSGASIGVQFKLAGSYVTSNYKFHVAESTSAGTGYAGDASASATSIVFIQGMGNTAGYSANFTMNIYTPSNTTLQKIIDVTGGLVKSGGAYELCSGGGLNTATGALTGLRFLTDGGNLSGTFKLYGVTN